MPVHLHAIDVSRFKYIKGVGRDTTGEVFNPNLAHINFKKRILWAG